ncbi:basic membrane protein A [Actinobaculum suis]|uniref:BMP family ABC transporter substrate-binding protein n=1 Tax=Actinobaculum suis TaxID=1657 RepID=A0A0K9EV75_9ACTO|nr:BMP family ABC transporter substrate-binding protein [Actinobaculum suis]KMY24064.1 membrane protein [Actinobaculum suis]MDY5154003.1 BMP family ABC transporter substrate-binding protein [Actinobaculum suis]OCA95874.1 BMP family ABC transporter substrate-binding protein [Actinobaculum suis]SDE03089.1 basic membrane protein A [Actinobaculum suis]VDG76851.1 putative lipoprotein [Actinobaculum suis]
MKKSKIAALLSVAAMVLTACGGGGAKGSGDASASGETAKSDYTACLVSDEGGWDDKSFNQSAYEGLKQAEKDFGISIKTSESKDSSDYAPNVEQMTNGGCNLIIGVGYSLNDAITNAANQNPDIHYGIVDDMLTKTGDNARSLVFNTQEAAYLAGYAAAAYTKTGTLGTFGGAKLPTVTIFMDGFVDGVAKYNQDKGTNVKVIGWDKEKQEGLFTNDFSDQAKGTQFAQQLMNQGADIIMPVAGPVGLGAAAAARSAGNTLIVGVDSDWHTSTEYGDIVLTSVMKEIGSSVHKTVEDGMGGKLDKAPYVGTLANKGVGIADFYGRELPAGLQDELTQLTKDISDGKIKVTSPSAYEVK